MRDPRAASPPIAWEDPSRSGADSLFATLASAVRPSATAPAFARPGVRPAVSFAVFVAAPLALLAGIIPFTFTLRFEPEFVVTLLGTPAPAPAEIAIDVVRAMGISLACYAALGLALTLPFWSLGRAYGIAGCGTSALRSMLYRAWLLPIGDAIFYLALWAAPPDFAAWLALVRALTFAPIFMLWASMVATARLACGAGSFVSFIVATVPFVVYFIAERLLAWGIGPFLPH